MKKQKRKQKPECQYRAPTINEWIVYGALTAFGAYCMYYGCQFDESSSQAPSQLERKVIEEEKRADRQ